MKKATARAASAAAMFFGALTMLAVTADYSDARGVRGTTAHSVHRGGGGAHRAAAPRGMSRRPTAPASRDFARSSSFRSGPARTGEISRGGQIARPDARASRADFNRNARGREVRRDANIDRNRNVNRNIDRNTNINRNWNTNVNVRDIDVNVDHGWRPGWGWDDYHPVATGVAVGAAAAVTSAALGSILYSLPPSCATYPYSGYTYYRCGDAWYQPQYAGDQVTYVVVEQPG